MGGLREEVSMREMSMREVSMGEVLIEEDFGESDRTAMQSANRGRVKINSLCQCVCLSKASFPKISLKSQAFQACRGKPIA